MYNVEREMFLLSVLVYLDDDIWDDLHLLGVVRITLY